MKVLFVGDNAIHGFVGGNAENRKYYNALKFYCIKNGHTFRVITRDAELSELLGITLTKSKKIDILVRAQGHSSFLYKTWKNNLNVIRNYNPDLIFLGRSRFGFIAKSVKKNMPNCKVVTNVDNVEWDYVDSYFADKKGICGLILKLLEKAVVWNDEKAAVKYSNKLVFLTKRNLERYKVIYKHTEENPIVIPICLEKEIELKKKSAYKNIVFIGSLDYESNIVAVKKLIQIWEMNFKGKSNIRLIIAGRNPSPAIRKLADKTENILLISDFKNIEDVVPRLSLMIAPIEKGAGMKVKVAEALSMGIMVAASDEALEGYESAVEKDVLGGIVRANSIDEYKESINRFIAQSNDNLLKIEAQNKKLFKLLYSYDVSNKCIGQLCETVLNNNIY